MIDDLISRQAATDALSNGALVNYQNAGHNNGLVKAIDVIKGLPSAQQWIPCNERLPEEGKEVLISTNGSIYISEYVMIDGRPFWYDFFEYVTIREVIAWMPLPEPYKQEENQ